MRTGDVVSGSGSASRGAVFRAVVMPVLMSIAMTVADGGRQAHAAFGLSDVAEKARKLAAEPYREPTQVPDWLRKLTYDQWRDIRYRPDRALWADASSRFRVQLFHAGLFYDRAVGINVVDAEGVRPLKFSPSNFDYGKNDFASKVPQDLGYAGFRLHYPLKRADYYDEVIVFLGASYFRAVGRDQVFGMSARGLAIDTALSSGEEFPYFTEFWLVRPSPDAREMEIYALLDSPSITGAYRYLVRPGEQTAVVVDTQIFPRREVQKIGIAPLTSMYFHGENTLREVTDFRPEVHDSDGLLLAFGNAEWLWRPLDNPRTLHVSASQMQHPRGFGLIQRDRDFDHYQDLETHAELRPSVWVVPHGDWGAGQVELIEIPTDSDANDNIASFWVPKDPPKLGGSASFSYTMYWYGEDANRPPDGRTVATRRDYGTMENVQRFVIDFDGKKLRAIPADRVLRGAVTVVGEGAGEIVDQQVVKNTESGGWRLTFQVRPARREPTELRAYLDRGGEALTETWSHAIVP